MNNNQYEFYFFYDWKTRPFFCENDIIVLNHDSKISFDTETARCFSEQVLIDPKTLETSSFREEITSSDFKKFKTSSGGIEFNISLPEAPDYFGTRYRGYVVVLGGFNNPNNNYSKIDISYSHKQLLLSDSIEYSIDFKNK